MSTRICIAATHPCLPGHFPGQPIVPGVIVLEHVLAAVAHAGGPAGRLRIPQVKFLQPLLPEEQAHIELERIEATDQAPTRWRFRVLRGDTVLVTGEVRGEASGEAGAG